jgi:hypothetical protein
VILGLEFWHSSNFWIPPPRSALDEPTRLEALALRAGVDANELRELLYDEIERRRNGTGSTPEIAARSRGHSVATLSF